MSWPLGPSASLGESRQRPSSVSLSPRTGRTRLRKAWARVVYGMSRLYWSNLPDANPPRGGTSAFCSSLTSEDLPMPAYPDTSTSSVAPFATTRSKAPSSVPISMLPAVERLRRHQTVRQVADAERERLYATMRLPFRQALAQIDRETRRRSGSGPRRSWRGASSPSPRAAPGCPRPARRAAAVAGQCGSAPTPWDRRPRTAACR